MNFEPKLQKLINDHCIQSMQEAESNEYFRTDLCKLYGTEQFDLVLAFYNDRIIELNWGIKIECMAARTSREAIDSLFQSHAEYVIRCILKDFSGYVGRSVEWYREAA